MRSVPELIAVLDGACSGPDATCATRGGFIGRLCRAAEHLSIPRVSSHMMFFRTRAQDRLLPPLIIARHDGQTCRCVICWCKAGSSLHAVVMGLHSTSVAAAVAASVTVAPRSGHFTSRLRLQAPALTQRGE